MPKKYRIVPILRNGVPLYMLQKKHWLWGWSPVILDDDQPVVAGTHEYLDLWKLLAHLSQKPEYL